MGKFGIIKIPLLVFVFLFASRTISASSINYAFDIVSTLGSVQNILAQIGPTLSAVLFILAGIFYAIGQLFPTYKRATFHSASIDIIIGAIIVAVLSVASTGLAVASTHLLTNSTVNSIINASSG
ncbi:MAG: hypothetical protein ACP5M9_01825 [Candidatus Micrarchaeia archaeon]